MNVKTLHRFWHRNANAKKKNYDGHVNQPITDDRILPLRQFMLLDWLRIPFLLNSNQVPPPTRQAAPLAAW